MNTKLLALASALVATTVLASTAEAGGGVRLGFGFPLGSFTATPAHGGGGGDVAPSHRRSKQVKRAAPSPSVREAARKPARTTPSESKSTDTAASESENSTESAPLTGTTALIQQSTPVDSAEPAAEPVSASPEVKAEAAPGPAPEAKSSVASVDKGAAETDSAGTCKKYVPAIGTTVSVGCSGE